MYKSVIFDMYGTLVDIYTNEYDPDVWVKMTQVLSVYGANYSATELCQLYFDRCRSYCQSTDDRPYPDMDISQVFADILAIKGVKVSKGEAGFIARTMRTHSTQQLALYDGVKSMLDQLKKAKIPMYLLTNAQKVFAMPELRQLGIAKYFKGIVISSNHLIAKPSKNLFDILLTKYNIDKSSTVMVGNDYTSDIQGANNVGIDSIYIHSNISPAAKPIDIDSTYTVSEGDYLQIVNIVTNN